MLNSLYEIIHQFNIWQQLLFGPVLSIVGILVSNLKLKKFPYLQKVVNVISVIWLVMSCILGIYDHLYIVEVPDFVAERYSYDEAEKIVKDKGLKLETNDKEYSSNYYVSKQNLEPGSLVKKGTSLVVEFEADTWDDSNYLEAVEQYNLQTREIAFKLFELSLSMLDDDNNEVNCIGNSITNSTDFNIVLKRQQDSLLNMPLEISTDYTIVQNYSRISKEAIVYSSVPYGTYDVYFDVDGYKSKKKELTVGDSMDVSNEIKIFLTPESSSQYSPSVIYFLGYNKERIECNSYAISMSDEDIEYNQDLSKSERTDTATILAYSGTEFNIHIMSSSGLEYYGNVKIPVSGENVYIVCHDALAIAEQISEEQYMRDYY